MLNGIHGHQDIESVLFRPHHTIGDGLDPLGRSDRGPAVLLHDDGHAGETSVREP